MEMTIWKVTDLGSKWLFSLLQKSKQRKSSLIEKQFNKADSQQDLEVKDLTGQDRLVMAVQFHIQFQCSHV